MGECAAQLPGSMRTSVADSVTGSEYSNRVSCCTSKIMALESENWDCPLLVEGILLLYGPCNVGAALQDAAQERVEVAVEDLL